MIESFLNYIKYEKRYSENTFISYKNDLEKFAGYLKDTYQIDDITLANYHMIRGWVVSLMENEYNARSVNRKIACLKSFYKYLKKNGKIIKNPTDKLSAPKVRKKLPQFVSEENLIQLLDQFHFSTDFEGTRDKLILELLYGTGIRLSELINLRTQQINKFDRTIKIIGKGNKERIIPLNENLYNLIDTYENMKRQRDAIMEYQIVTDEGKQTYPMFVYRIVNKYLPMVSTIEKKSPHVLRHSFATHLLNKGADLNAIKDLLGHSSLAATQVYTHNSLDKLKAIFDQAHPKA